MPRYKSEERSAQYYALFEPTDILENGRWNLDAPVLIDAMPVASAESFATMDEAPDNVDFLLLSVDAREVEDYELSDEEYARGEDAWCLIIFPTATSPAPSLCGHFQLVMALVREVGLKDSTCPCRRTRQDARRPRAITCAPF
ncbi:hypothetical protein CEE57_07710 [Stenotrophomonas maltophilia]|uniref:hypothetical protein n=1 Tax=Stenotrophomonas maltophilia TaxID=40324 RepID=UPI000B4C474E|nr:hypothetical protein [Stenotrophomonas maltophilia]OWQ73117.1 hypothetical protein CEE57_07710 [Stenotrophomonas maltophilia]